ncbi:MAG: N-formylglutamate amidohydrolase [Paracoccaceae bacterium]|nr:N-formylglutamate amidohydrolase [Paracoccaceae bacterium]
MSDTRSQSEVLPVAEVIAAEAAGPLVVVCEHASPFIPEVFARLGVSEEVATSHAAWDPGAGALAERIARRFDSPYVRSNVSRMVYDCNRPPEAEDAMPRLSEIYLIPGNDGLTETQRHRRIDDYYRPFETLLEATLSARPSAVLVTVHSFTPVYRGLRRDVEIGIVHDTDRRLADAVLDVAAGYDIRRNEPYAPEDGVTHTLKRHALPTGRLNVMLEVRNDLLATGGAIDKMADCLSGWLDLALARLAAEAGA